MYTLISRIIFNLTIYVPTHCIYIIITCKRIVINSLNSTKFYRVPHIDTQGSKYVSFFRKTRGYKLKHIS